MKDKYTTINNTYAKQAYQNLSDYDTGLYKPKSREELLKESQQHATKVSPTETNDNLSITEDEIESYLELGRKLNSLHSDFSPGEFADISSYKASFSKKGYFYSKIEFISSLFISHHNIHAFFDGNKRTALNILLELLRNAGYELVGEHVLYVQDAQILYLEKHLQQAELEHIINNGLIEIKG